MLFQYINNLFIKSLFIFLLLGSYIVNAQIVNVENLRHKIDSTGWSGHARIDTQIEKNNDNRIFDFSNQLRIQYTREKSVWFLIHDMSFKEVNASEIRNNSTQHLRYSHVLSKKISFEAFLQSQTDRVSEIKLRALVGTGLRFNLYNSKKYKFFLGTTIMYEHENSVNNIDIVQNNLRTSTYFTFKIKPNENISIVGSSYYQPLINQLSDFRILNETAVLLKVFKNLKFITTIYYTFDSFPVTTVAKEQFKITNGLIYSFD